MSPPFAYRLQYHYSWGEETGVIRYMGEVRVGIAVVCEHCKGQFQVKDALAGRRGKCPKCQQVIEVPKANTSTVTQMPPKTAAKTTTSHDQAAAPDPRAMANEVLAAIDRQIEPVAVPFSYQLGVFLAAIVMVILPLVYVGIVTIFAWGVYLHATNSWTWIENAPAGRAGALAFFIYIAIFAVGIGLLLFMIKPLFAKSVKSAKPRSLSRENEPLLFSFVDRICAAVGAPLPKRIDVDSQVNASASFRRGLFSVLLGNDLVLTIGMPLVTGFSMRQFAGVLAHEFGHFSQGTGMRLSYIVRSINFWFARVVYERDEWDQRLSEWSQNTDIRIAVFLWAIQICIWITRKILWCLMMVGHFVSGYMLRQMEYDADRYEARLAGSDTFESTARRLHVLNVAYGAAEADLQDFYREGRLGDNLPLLLMANVEQLPKEILQKLDEHIDTNTTGAFDTHPADKDRIASANAEAAAGVFRLDYPATWLFSNFAGLARDTTLDYYRGIFGPQFKASEMHPIDDLLKRQKQQMQDGEALERYFQGNFSILRSIPMSVVKLPKSNSPDLKAIAKELQIARQTMISGADAYRTNFKHYDKADDLSLESYRVTALLECQFTLPAADFEIPVGTRSEARVAGEKARHRMEALRDRFADFEDAAAQRIHAACILIDASQLTNKLADAEQLRSEAKRLMPTWKTLNNHHRSVLNLRFEHTRFAMLVAVLEGNEENERLIEAIRESMRKVKQEINHLANTLAGEPYPFDHAKGAISIRDYAVSQVPHDDDDLGGIYDAAGEMLDKLPALHHRVACRIVALAEQVETALGLPLMPAPPKDDDETSTE